GPMLAKDKAPNDKKVTAVKKAQPKKAPDAAPKKEAAKTTKLTITAVSVSGIAEQLSTSNKNAKWTRLKTGDILNERTIVRTGLGAKVVLKFLPLGTVVTMNSVAKIGIAKFRKSRGKVRTTLGLKYGAIRAEVDSSQGANDFRVRTGAGTLAATGTGGLIAQWGDFSFQAKGTEGTWVQVSQRDITLIAGQWTDAEMTLPLDKLLEKYGITISDEFGGRTPRELLEWLKNNSGFIGNTGKPNSKKGSRLSKQTATPCPATTSQHSSPPVDGMDNYNE
ncbi:MAG: FecR domain-containing protein, partial [bacterium]|nr:FecR domain-containing protein [bacterium]